MFADRRVFDAEDPGAGVSFGEAVCLAEAMFGTIGTTGSYTPPRSAARYKGGGVGPSPTYSYSAAIVEVEVDESTGWIHVPRVWIAHDIGRALNPVARPRADRRQRLHGARRSADGGTGVPPPAAAAVAGARPQVSRRCSSTRARRRSTCRRSSPSSSSIPIRAGRSAPRKSDRDRCFRSCRRSPTPSTTRSACGSTRSRSRRRRSLKALAGEGRGARRRASARRGFPTSPGRRRCRSRRRGTAATGRRGRRAQPPRGRASSSASPRGEITTMMRLPHFNYHAPRSVREAVELLAAAPADSMLVAGGTDLLPNMKRRQQTPVDPDRPARHRRA